MIFVLKSANSWIFHKHPISFDTWTDENWLLRCLTEVSPQKTYLEPWRSRLAGLWFYFMVIPQKRWKSHCSPFHFSIFWRAGVKITKASFCQLKSLLLLPGIGRGRNLQSPALPLLCTHPASFRSSPLGLKRGFPHNCDILFSSLCAKKSKDKKSWNPKSRKGVGLDFLQQVLKGMYLGCMPGSFSCGSAIAPRYREKMHVHLSS